MRPLAPAQPAETPWHSAAWQIKFDEAYKVDKVDKFDNHLLKTFTATLHFNTL